MHQQRPSRQRDICSGVTAIISSLLWLGSVVIGVLGDTDGLCFRNLRFAIFRQKTKNIYQIWMTDMTPAGWTFTLREFVYTWNMFWVAYCVTIACRPVKKCEGLPYPCNIFPARLHGMWCCCSITHACWVALWDREAFVACLFMQIFIISSCVMTLIISHKNTYRYGASLQFKHPWDLWISRTLLQNGVIIMATWHLFTFAINTVILLVHRTALPMHLSSTIVLGSFGVFVLVWTVLELCVLDRWLRYTFAFYPTALWCAVGVGVEHFHMWSPVFIICVVIMLFCFLVLIVRVPLVIWRSFNDPLYIEQTLPCKIDTSRLRQQCITTVL